MITKDVALIKQAKEVIEGQLSCINEILAADENLESEASRNLVTKNMTIIAMALQSLTR